MSLAELNRAIQTDAADATALYYAGVKLNQLGRCDEAAGRLKQAAEHAPDEARIREAWMNALLGSGQSTAALQELQQFESMDSSSAAAHRLLGQFYVSQHSMVRANAELSQATNLDPADRAAWVYLAGARQDVLDVQGAIDAEERAIALDGRQAGDHLYLGSLYDQKGRTADALREYRKALGQAPRLAAAHREYARWLLRFGASTADVMTAETEARKAAVLDPDDGAAQEALGRRPSARRWCAQELRATP